MTVYIEYVILDNLLIDYFLLKATFLISGANYSKRRVLACSFLGAFFALIFPLTESIFIVNVIVKVLAGVVIILSANSYASFRALYVNFAIFMLLTFLTGGAITGVGNLLNINFSSEFSVAIIFLPAYLVIKAVSSVIMGIYKNKNVMAYVFRTEIYYGEKVINVNGFLDTGNALFDGENPVIICQKKLFFSLLKANLIKAKLKKIAVQTVNGSSKNLSFVVDKVLIYTDDKVNINNNVTVALATFNLGDGYDVILNPALIKGEHYEHQKELKKTS